MRILRSLVLLFCVPLAAAPGNARGEDWMFRRSYYSHGPQPGDATNPPLVSRSAYRRAFVSEGPGFAVRGGWRYNTVYLRSGSSTDVTVYRENWFDVSP